MGKISEEKNNVGDNNEERDTFNEDIKETSNRVRLRKPKKKVSRFVNCKLECVFPMVIWPAFHMERYRVSDHPYHAPQFIMIPYRCEETVVAL